ncbi:uncharacterized protein [Clytia hemisphaerica]|uniref:uncharacterized protein isoform X2 n=1 Tax=Clytia hemisphaerica TaxID=252671 RepID=UPI0034D720F3
MSTVLLENCSFAYRKLMIQTDFYRILDNRIGKDGIRYYKVTWQEAWLPEHQLIQHQTLIEAYWRTQNDLTNANNAGESSHTITSNANKVQIAVSNISKSTNAPFYGNLNLTELTAAATTNASNAGDAPETQSTPATIKIKAKNTTSSAKTPTDSTVEATDESAVTAAAHTILAQVMKDSEVEKAVEGEEGQDENTYIEIPLNVVLEATIEAENAATNESTPKVELKPHQAAWRKKANSSSLQLDGFDLVNIENSNASMEELEANARETLSSFRRKRVRFPNGTSKLPQECFFCLKKLSNRKKLREHQFSVHFKNVGEFMCGICKQRFVFGRQLKAHMLVHSDNRNYQCQYCGLTCKRRSHLHKHVQTHNQERNYRCDVCHTNFKVQAELKDHCMSDHKNQTNQCNVCKQTLHTPFSVYIHSMRHSGTRDHICETCGASFKRKQHLIAHRNTHAELREKIKCPACDKEVPDRKYLRRHMEQMHKELAADYRYDYICELCGKDFAYKGRLDEHMKTHANETDEDRHSRVKKKRVDSLSDEALDQISDQAIKYVDPKTQEVKLRCKLCRKREFRMISSFEKHIQDHKAGRVQMAAPDAIDCEQCDRSFNSAKRLERHMLTHQNKQEFECTRCEQSFSARSILQAHLRKCAIPTNKGAEKRKATLKAKEEMMRQLKNLSDDELDDDVVMDEEDDDVIKEGEEVVQTESAVAHAHEEETDEPMVAMQHEGETLTINTEEEEENELRFVEQTEMEVVNANDETSVQAETALVALQVIQANQQEAASLQEIINNPQSNATLSYVMECVSQAVANEQVLASGEEGLVVGGEGAQLTGSMEIQSHQIISVSVQAQDETDTNITQDVEGFIQQDVSDPNPENE